MMSKALPALRQRNVCSGAGSWSRAADHGTLDTSCTKSKPMRMGAIAKLYALIWVQLPTLRWYGLVSCGVGEVQQRAVPTGARL